MRLRGELHKVDMVIAQMSLDNVVKLVCDCVCAVQCSIRRINKLCTVTATGCQAVLLEQTKWVWPQRSDKYCPNLLVLIVFLLLHGFFGWHHACLIGSQPMVTAEAVDSAELHQGSRSWRLGRAVWPGVASSSHPHPGRNRR